MRWPTCDETPAAAVKGVWLGTDVSNEGRSARVIIVVPVADRIMMQANKFETAIVAELAALRYALEHVGEIAFLAGAMRSPSTRQPRAKPRKKD